jgi:acyl-CoA synthetase (AMP-forming)/AMP-acid ligase II
VDTLRAIAALAPNASLHTPYGMTEALPVADIDLDQIEAAIIDDPAGGVCVGHPVAGADVRIQPLGFDPEHPVDDVEAGETGEILVSAPWVSDGYFALWATERAARPSFGEVWHRSGDVGHVDDRGRLWVEGRSVHVVDAAGGPITPVPIERAVESELGYDRVAAVGVGPAGVQQLVVVIEDREGDDGLASDDIARRVRATVEVPVAAVLRLRHIPVDIRHNAKIDRSAVSRWAGELLAGRRARRPN